MSEAKKKFGVLILTHGRPDNVVTYATLRKSGYTGPIWLVVDDLDPTRLTYIERYGDEVIVFDKKRAGETTDSGDNFGSLRGVVYARNVAFDVARSLGLDYFVELDDDYGQFRYRFDDKRDYNPMTIKKQLDPIFAAFVDFLATTKTTSIAMAQGGDFIGGEAGMFGQKVFLRRKAMNSFFCAVDRPFSFYGRINEDVTMYVTLGSRGGLFFTMNQVALEQIQTQQNPGGLTELYLDAGTYVKSFYSVMYQPSSVKVSIIRGPGSMRLHHRISWKNTAPMIVRESTKKKRATKSRKRA